MASLNNFDGLWGIGGGEVAFCCVVSGLGALGQGHSGLPCESPLRAPIKEVVGVRALGWQVYI